MLVNAVILSRSNQSEYQKYPDIGRSAHLKYKI